MDFEQAMEFMNAAKESGIIKEIAQILAEFKRELEAAGFTEEQAMQIVLAKDTGFSFSK